MTSTTQPSPPPTLDVTLLRALLAPYARPVQVQRRGLR